MTEQPVETEQQFLGNEPTVIELADAYEAKAKVLAEARQHYVPNAHLRRPAWSPVDDVELAALVRKCAAVAKLSAIAKDQSFTAEVALQTALQVEDEAAKKLHEAEKALIAFARKGSGL